ncbi:MAG: LytTR family transcriptional regulator [Bacteroidetes bacterium]|nr:LytTR family transcriptional regulator [Bacteroidota bacterium]
MNKNLNQLIFLLKEDVGLLISISLGVFLFILFFQPFPYENIDLNNNLLFVGGLAAIVFLVMVIVRVVSPWLIRKYDHKDYQSIFSSFMGGFIMVVLSAVAFAFYLFYIGSIEITFFIMFKVGLICFAPPVALRLYDLIKRLKVENMSLHKQLNIFQKQLSKNEEEDLNKVVELLSESLTEKLSLPVKDIAFIKSADNYVEIVYKDTGQFKKKLLRNTLKNIEQQLKPFHDFIRCHRICIVNKQHIDKLNKDYSHHWLTIKDFKEQIPVSRQYLMKLKETI